MSKPIRIDNGTSAPVSDQVMTAYRFDLFGPPSFKTSAGDSIAIRSRRGVGLLACLVLAEGKPVGRDQLCALLWSNRQTPQARASLRQ